MRRPMLEITCSKVYLIVAHHNTSTVASMNRASYTVDFKLSVVDWVESGGRSLREASKQFGVDRKCIRHWVKERAVLGSARVQQGPQTRKLHGGRCPRSQDLDRLVLGFMMELRGRGLTVTDQELKQKALELSQLLDLKNFKASPSWLKGWKYRNGLADRTPVEGSSQLPLGSAVLSHITSLDTVSLSSLCPSSQKPADCHDNSCQSNSRPGTDPHVPSDTLTPVSHVTTALSHVITGDHTYARQSSTSERSVATFPSTHDITPDSSLTDHVSSLNSSSHHDDGEPLVSCVELLGIPLGGHLLETADRFLSIPISPYCSIQSMCVPSSDPVMSSTQVDHICELDMSLPLEHEEVVIGEPLSKSDNILSSLPLVTTPTSLASLSPPKRSSVESRHLLWPTIGCNRTSSVTFPEFHDFTDPLTGLLANRRLQPVFSAGPEILVSTTETS